MSTHYDVIVIGGGPSGLMAAITAQNAGATTLLVEKGHKLGRKLAISGGGRCNVTNAKPLDELIKNIPGNGRFMYSALSQFSNREIIQFFEDLGIALKEEDRGRVFPQSNKASTVVKALVDQLLTAGVKILQDSPVAALQARDGMIDGIELVSGSLLHAKAVVVATGGASVPATGSTGDAYPWARALGHHIVDPYPTEVPLTSNAAVIIQRRLQGLSLQNVMVRLTDHNKTLTTESGDLLFSHFGLTGPVALRLSHYVSTALRHNPHAAMIAWIDLAPHELTDNLTTAFYHARHQVPKRQVKTMMNQTWPERLTEVLLESAEISSSLPLAQLSNVQIQALVHTIKNFPVTITGTLPLEKATVTGGGVSIKDIDPRTMASKRCRGLYFAGEVIDVHAHTGGYNITVAFSTGYVAGQHAALFAQSQDAASS
ncbi:NAD(P)/FAD-dependent oxidoreductase [Sulfobacillus thermosulfidooxidans]|uniref:NAD(P)/FAD-dependent oxidoreductase n=1 Tax=Sulfobacillus thermosulfidooxidans TaxID=28034 RepID=UPI0009E751AC|nr:NAD(P)/FAD-dependent oxidoreductase [Sulfobacillus thermosulfidooxidans]